MTDNITEDSVRKVATLARIGLKEHELKQYIGDFNNVLGLIEQLNTVDTNAIEPMYSSLPTALPLREDKVSEKNQRETLQKLTKHTESGLYLVPQVME